MPILDDRFRNVLSIAVTQSAADTLTFQEVTTGVSLGQGLGMVIDTIDLKLNSAFWQALVNNADSVQCGLTTSEQVTDLSDFADSRIIDVFTMTTRLIGTAGEASILMEPLHHDFTPPLILATPRLFIALSSANIGAPSTAQMRVGFRYVKLSPNEYLEIAETFLNL